MKCDVAPLREEHHSVSSLQTHVPREPHVCRSDGSPSWELRTASPRGRYGGTPSA